MGYRWRLSSMMFLQYAIWGAWAPVLGAYLGPNEHGMRDATHLALSGVQTGLIFSLLPLATIVSPFIFGQIADRYVATQRVLAVAHFCGGLALLGMAFQRDFSGMMWLMLVSSLLYAPTLALSNSICFHNLRDPEREFGGLRVWGTIGWIIAGWLLALWRSHFSTIEGTADSLLLAGVFALILGVFSLALPDTPPKRESANPLAFVEAFRLFKNRNFAIFMAISFIVGTELEFYYILTSPFLEHLRVAGSRIPLVMTIAQLAEIFTMAVLLPKWLPWLGARRMLAVGAIAWPIRYAIFALGAAIWPIGRMLFNVDYSTILVIASLPLHGFCYVFFFVVGFIYVDSVASKDIKASAQSLVALVVLGLGRYLGSIFAGVIKDQFTSGAGAQAVTNWQGVFLVPCALTVICAIAFLVAFREEKAGTPAAEEATAKVEA